MQQPEVYADVTFVINLIMDFVILWATARLARITPDYRRIMLAAVLGGFYAVGFLLPQLVFFYHLPAKIVFSGLMLVIGLPMRDWNDFKKAFIFFYIINFTVAGATVAFSYLMENEGWNAISNYLWLFSAVIFAVLIGVFGGRYISKKIIPGLLKFGVNLRFDEKNCSGKGFLDTGNSLRDPLTNKPVIVAEYDLIKNCLPGDFQRAIEDHTDEEQMLEQLMNSSWSNRLRLIPFTSIGKQNGIMLGIRADEVKVELGTDRPEYRNMVIGIYRGKLSQRDNYQMLVPAEIVEN